MNIFKNAKMKCKNDFIFLSLIFIIFLVLQVNQLIIPAPNDEETIDAEITIRLLQKVSNYIEESQFGIINFLLDRFKFFIESGILPFETMAGFYHGALQSYLMLPFFICFDNHAISLRIYEVFVGLLIILATYFMTKEFFDRKTAYFATILLTLNFTFILGTTKYGIAYGSITQVITLLSLLFFLRFYRKRNFMYLYLSFFLLGLGVSVRSYFLWVIVALLFESIIFRKELFKIFFLKYSKAYSLLLHFAIVIIFFCLGAFLIIYHNISSDFETVKYAIDHFKITPSGVNNLYYFQNLFLRIKQFIFLLAGELEYAVQIHSYSRNYLFPFMFGICFLWLIYFCINTEFAKMPCIYINKKKVLFFISLFLSIFVLSASTLSMLRRNHLMILYPLIQILIAIAIVSFIQFFKSKIVKTIFLTICSLAVIWDLVLFFEIRSDFIKTGGRGLYSDSIYQLADFLKIQSTLNIYTFNPGMKSILTVLTKNTKTINWTKISSLDMDRDTGIVKLPPNAFDEKNNLYIFLISCYNPESCDNREYTIFKSTIEGQSRIIKEKQFYDRRGMPTFVICRVE